MNRTYRLLGIHIWRFLQCAVLGGAFWFAAKRTGLLHRFGKEYELPTIEGDLISALIFGVSIAGLVSLIDYWSLRKKREVPIDWLLSPRVIAKLRSPEAPEIVYTQCLRGLEADDRFVIRNASETDKTIEGRFRWTWKSFGEHLTVSVMPARDGASRVLVESTPRLRSTVFDYGKGVDNVQRIQSFIAGPDPMVA